MTRRHVSPFHCSAVISDVDGTLVTDDKCLTSRTRAAVGDLRAREIKFSMISSRPPRGVGMLIAALGVTTPIGCFNGGVIATADGSVVTAHLLSPAVARRVVDTLDAHGVQVWIFSGQDWLLRDSDGAYVGLEARTLQFRPNLVAEFGAALDRVAKIVGVSADFELLARCESDVRARLADDVTIARSQPYFLDMTHPRANKGDAVTEIATLLAIPLAEIAVIGDGANDVAMFERGGLSIAMGNANPAVQQAADYVTDSNDNDGFASAIDRFILAGRQTARPGFARSGARA
jgi:Cof subfamily protein (haloacid dehalogenase superfamily)